ncbi:MAG: hypothetical protein HFE83_10085 [Lachnospiraceae bacterium]|nr:hypothetical protein [Lachnospiraceae bacterium]
MKRIIAVLLSIWMAAMGTMPAYAAGPDRLPEIGTYVEPFTDVPASSVK